LIQAVTKPKSMELIVQKATELGATRLVPVLSERSVAQLAGEAAERKTEKWRTIAIEAIKQCGSPWLPAIEEPVKPGVFLARGERFDLVLLASLQPGCRARCCRLITPSTPGRRDRSPCGSGRKGILRRRNWARSAAPGRRQSRWGRWSFVARPPPFTVCPFSATNSRPRLLE
jgi:hypothetical protein